MKFPTKVYFDLLDIFNDEFDTDQLSRDYFFYFLRDEEEMVFWARKVKEREEAIKGKGEPLLGWFADALQASYSDDLENTLDDLKKNEGCLPISYEFLKACADNINWELGAEFVVSASRYLVEKKVI